MNSQRYSQAQVMCGLREVWQSNISPWASPIEADTQIYRYMKADGTWDELDLFDVFHRIERFFGFSCSQEEWIVFLGIKDAKSVAEWEQQYLPNLTFGVMAKFIADRAPVVASFEPITMLGRPCASAGIFTGIEKVAAKVRSDRPRFAPSTRILDVMRGGDLHRFWTQLRWMTEDSAPPLPSFWRNVTTYAVLLGLLMLPLGVFASKVSSSLLVFYLTPVFALIPYLMARFYKQRTNPLPSQLVSFRDLSMLIAESRSRAAA